MKTLSFFPWLVKPRLNVDYWNAASDFVFEKNRSFLNSKDIKTRQEQHALIRNTNFDKNTMKWYSKSHFKYLQFLSGKKNVLINPKWNIIFKLPSWRTTFFPSANKSRWTGILNVNVAFCSCKWESFVNLSNKTLVWIIDFFSCLAIFPKLFTIITIRWNIVSFFVYDLRNLFVLSTLFLLAFGTHSHIS